MRARNEPQRESFVERALTESLGSLPPPKVSSGFVTSVVERLPPAPRRRHEAAERLVMGAYVFVALVLWVGVLARLEPVAMELLADWAVRTLAALLLLAGPAITAAGRTSLVRAALLVILAFTPQEPRLETES